MQSRRSPVALLPLVLAACSFTGPSRVECGDHLECRDAFGPGQVCAADGYCTEAIHDRCDRTAPANLFAHPERYSDAIVIGSLQDLSLETKQAREKAAQLAVTQANAEGGLDGRSFGLVLCTLAVDEASDQSQAEATAEVARFLVDEVGVAVIIGPSSSVLVQEAFWALQGSDTLIMSPAASSPVLSTLETGTPGLLWRSTPPDSLQGTAIAADMQGPGAGREAAVNAVAVIHETGAYGAGLAEAFNTGFVDDGGSATLLPFDNNNQMIEALTAASLGSDEEVLLVAQTSTAVTLARTAAGLAGFSDKRFFVTDTAANTDFIEGADDALFDRMRGARPKPLDPESSFAYASFLAAYLAEYDDDAAVHSFTPHAYDAAWLVMYGAAWSQIEGGAVTGPGIARGLRQISEGQEVVVRAAGWHEVVADFEQGLSVDVTGASGELDYDPITEETSGPVEIWVVEDGAIVGIDTWFPSSGG